MRQQPDRLVHDVVHHITEPARTLVSAPGAVSFATFAVTGSGTNAGNVKLGYGMKCLVVVEQ